MRRDLDFLRELLLELEEKLPEENELGIDDLVPLKFPDEPSVDVDDEAYDNYELEKAVYEAEYKKYAYYIQLLLDSKFIVAVDASNVNYPEYNILRLTSAGCDYIDSIRDTRVWNKVKEKLSTVGGSAALEIVKSIAISCIKGVLGI